MSYVDCTPEDLPAYEANLCYYPKGGISKSFVLKTGYTTTDFSNPSQVQADITAGRMRIMGGLKGNLPEPSVVEGENPIACGSETIVDGYDYTFEVKDFNVNEGNDEFYRKLNQSEFSGFGFYLCEQNAVRVIEKGVTFNARLVIPESNKEKQHYLVTAKWSQDVADPFPVLYDAPVGIF